MAIAIKGLLALFWLVAVPFAAGIPFLQKKQKCMAPEYLLVGYLVLFSVTEVLTLFATWKKLPLHYGVRRNFPDTFSCGDTLLCKKQKTPVGYFCQKYFCIFLDGSSGNCLSDCYVCVSCTYGCR